MDAPGLIPSLIGAPLSPAGGPAAGTVVDLLVDATSHPVWSMRPPVLCSFIAR